MSKKECAEIAEFRVLAEVNEERFVRIIDDLERNFHSNQQGFISTELLRGNEPYQWIMIQHWESAEVAREASKKMMKEPVTEAFRETLDVGTIKLRYLDQVNTWSR